MLVCIGQFIQVSINIAKYTVRKLTFKRILAVIHQFIHAILVLVLLELEFLLLEQHHEWKI